MIATVLKLSMLCDTSCSSPNVVIRCTVCLAADRSAQTMHYLVKMTVNLDEETGNNKELAFWLSRRGQLTWPDFQHNQAHSNLLSENISTHRKEPSSAEPDLGSSQQLSERARVRHLSGKAIT